MVFRQDAMHDVLIDLALLSLEHPQRFFKLRVKSSRDAVSHRVCTRQLCHVRRRSKSRKADDSAPPTAVTIGDPLNEYELGNEPLRLFTDISGEPFWTVVAEVKVAHHHAYFSFPDGTDSER
jgi:hypothetical protein